MYTSSKNVNGVEAICYEKEHQNEVLAVLATEFEKAFPGFVESEAGQLISEEQFLELQKVFKIVPNARKEEKNRCENFKSIIEKKIEEFEKNRQKYVDLMDPDLLEEEGEDLQAFKSKTLRNECPIIHATLYTQRDELKQYKKDFQSAPSKRLYDVVVNLSQFSRDYCASYNEDAYQQINDFEDLKLGTLEEGGETYTAYGVIGGGIRSHLLYKIHPECFPNRSQWAVWAMWYLTNQDSFGCEMDSEFLMIDVKSCITQQNYFYPYDLFTFYAYQIYKMLDSKAKEMNVFIDPQYKYVIVDAFMNYIADLHIDHINELRKQIANGGYGNVWA
ncbi:hypothetical protein JS518_15465 [Clostridiales bacterium FE2010]|nr:hypothetical protein JS518_15465 [Clostridiales bacterium FE2010]